jgi:hypothetical protein
VRVKVRRARMSTATALPPFPLLQRSLLQLQVRIPVLSTQPATASVVEQSKFVPAETG